MENRPNVVIVMACCRQTKQHFGIRFEEKENDTLGLKSNLDLPRRMWLGDWAFKMDNKLGKREGYDKNEINGIISLDINVYPGCPHCFSKLIFKCSCGQVGCCDSPNQIVTCPNCGMTARLNGYIKRLKGGNDL